MANQLNEQISVSVQIKPEEVQNLADEGFEVVICNRPDGEEAGQPSVAEIQGAVEKAGLEFVHIPILSGQFTPEAIGAYGEVVDSGRRIFAYCRTGTRSAALWALSQAGKIPADDILAATKGAGYDFSSLEPMLRSMER